MEKWRASYEAGLRKPDGWLSVAGLFWLHEGANSVGSQAGNVVRLPRGPARFGAVELHNGQAKLNDVPLPGSEKPLAPPGLKGVTLALLKRGGKYAIRMRDPESEARREFSGLHWFPVRESYRVQAQFHTYPEPRKIPITNILGTTEPEDSPGYAEFTLHGKQFRLEPVVEEPNDLFFMFRDLTSGRETYGAGRFLHAAMPKDGMITLDFNKAYNPPCAYTAFATCPLPPKENRLNLRVEAGEKIYGSGKH